MALDFQLNLTGQFAAALEPVKKGLGDTSKKLDETRKGVNLFESELGKLKTSSSGFSLDFAAKGDSSFFTFNVADGIGAAVNALTSLIGKVADLGKEIVKASAEAQDLNLAVRLNIGEKGAGDVDALTEGFRRTTRFDDDDIKKALLPLLDVGVKDLRLLDDMATAAADVSARRNSGIAGVNEALSAFEAIAIKREVNGKVLKSLAINENDYFANLADLLHVSKDRAKELTEKGKVASETLLSVATSEIAKRQGGALGIASLAADKTLGATLERLSALPANLFKELAETPGIQRLQKVLDNFITVMSGDQGKELMKEIGEVIADASEFLLGFLSSKDGLRSMGEVLKGFIWVVRDIGAGFRTMYMEVKAVADGLGKVISLIKLVNPQIVYGNQLQAAHELLGGKDGPQALLDGLNKGLAAGKGEVQKAGADTVAAVDEGARVKAESHSPSQLFARLGMDLASGMAAGINAGREGPRSAARAMITDAVLGSSKETPASIALSARGPGGDVTVIVNQYGIAGDEAPQRTAEVVRIELQKFFVEGGHQLGADPA